MTIKGRIIFPGPERVLPQNSCLLIHFQDTSLMDASAVTISSEKFDVSGHNTGNVFHYKMHSLKPTDDELSRDYTLQATIFVSWCPEKRAAVRIGDYTIDTVHQVHLSANSNLFEKDIKLICYSKFIDNLITVCHTTMHKSNSFKNWNFYIFFWLF